MENNEGKKSMNPIQIKWLIELHRKYGNEWKILPNWLDFWLTCWMYSTDLFQHFENFEISQTGQKCFPGCFQHLEQQHVINFEIVRIIQSIKKIVACLSLIRYCTHFSRTNIICLAPTSVLQNCKICILNILSNCRYQFDAHFQISL